LDFGATGTQYLWWAYQGTNTFAKDPEGPRRDLRLIANIEQPSYFLVAVRADSPITDLRQIRENRLKVKFMLSDIMRDAYEMMDHYNLSEGAIKELGGQIVGSGPENRENLDVVAGWASLVTAPEYSYWMDIAHRNKLRFLELPKDLLDQWAKKMDMEVRNVPPGLLPGLENRTFPTVAKSGTAVYGRTDMPEEFAYALAKALDEGQARLHWTHMNWFYDWRTVSKAYGVPLHPGAEKYYREVGYIK
jgi:TRAP transporter TAXI family solute receptor